MIYICDGGSQSMTEEKEKKKKKKKKKDYYSSSIRLGYLWLVWLASTCLPPYGVSCNLCNLQKGLRAEELCSQSWPQNLPRSLMPTYAKAEGSLVGRKWLKLGAGSQGNPQGSRYPRLEAERVPPPSSPPSSLPFHPPFPASSLRPMETGWDKPSELRWGIIHRNYYPGSKQKYILNVLYKCTVRSLSEILFLMLKDINKDS